MSSRYADTVRRFQMGRKDRLSDAEVIEALADEIDRYRATIKEFYTGKAPIRCEECEYWAFSAGKEKHLICSKYNHAARGKDYCAWGKKCDL